MNRTQRPPSLTRLLHSGLALATACLALLVPDWKQQIMAQGYYTNLPAIVSVSTADNSFGLWGDNIAPEPDCYGSIGNCPGKRFIDNSAWSIPNGKSEWDSNASTTQFTAQQFSIRYTNELRSEGQVAINTALYYKPRMTASISIAGEGKWQLEVDVTRVASIVVRERDGGSTNRIDVSELSTSVSGGSLSSGSLALPSLPRYTTQGTYAVNQNGKAIIEGNGAATLTFSLVYDINTMIHGATIGNSDSVCWMAGQANQGASIDCNPSPQATQGLWLKGTLKVNQAPEAHPDSYEVTNAGTQVIGNVLDNDTDAEGNALNVMGIDTSDTQGRVISRGDGTFEYDGRDAFSHLDETQTATDRFYYRASDGDKGSNLTTVIIQVKGTRSRILPLDGIFKGSVIQERSGF